MDQNNTNFAEIKRRLNEPVNVPRKGRYSNSRIWYAAAIPLITLFIEMYANRFELGVLVWCCCIISSSAACLLDKRYLKEQGADVGDLPSAMAILPPLYIFRRVTITGDQNTAAIVWICFAFYAACANGFSRGIMMDEDKMISQVKDNYWTSIVNVKSCEGAEAAGIIEKTVSKAPKTLGAKGKAKWKAKRIGKKYGLKDMGKKDRNVIVVTVTRGDLTLKFNALYDGYTFREIYLTEYSDGMVTVKYDKKGDNTLFNKYVETLLKSKSSKKSDSKETESSADSKAEESAAEKAAA